MKVIFFLCLWGLITNAVLAQKMLASGEWCAKKGKIAAAFGSINNDFRSDSVDILHATVHSWIYNNQQINITFTYDLDTALPPYQVNIYYHGKPVQDASGWGGFYWQSGYAYNLGGLRVERAS